jgi:CheY-like chemotaxis protein
LARKILLADDSVTAQNMGRRILADAGYEVVTVNNGSAALKKIAELEPELIVLDVYMPGYSGLEVCQRVKAAPETAAIPILLTVGKLEPFKADEAKRVFADAFIVKPFEATELLAALTKLEEKIVPQKTAKAAPAKSAPSKEAAKKEKPQQTQEDQEWKDRLRIQATPVRAEEREAPAPIASQFRDIRHEIAAAETDEAISRNLPGDVTSEELAAITAAVTAFTAESDAAYEPAPVQESELEGAPVEEVQAYAPAEQAAQNHEKSVEAEHDSANEQPEPAEEVAQSEETNFLKSISPWANPALLEEVAAALKGPATEEIEELEEEPEEPEVAAVTASTPADGFTDSDVDAALASLSSLATTDMMSRLHAEEQARQQSLGDVDAQATESLTEEPATIGSTRWIAEEMKLEESEASLVLEEEMQRALAAMQLQAEAEAIENVPSQSSIEAVAEEVPVEESAPVEAVSSIEVPEAQPEEFVAEVATTEVATAEVQEQLNSYAAAASAGAAPVPSYSEPQVNTSSPVETVSEPESREPDPELAEAWARWRQIRESVASPQFVSQVADVAAAEISETAQPSEPTPEPTATQVDNSAPDSAAIASIVDSVLADLRPRLVAEIAKKMSEKK